MRIKGQNNTTKAFALPTVLIASVVLLTILAVSVTATTAVRTALKTQYYVQLAQVAGESGVAYAKACLAANGNIPTWTDAKPLTPATDCSGNVILGPNVKALVVAGGGSGGGSTGGGGGAGGVLYKESLAVDQTSYPIVVGAGGAAPGNQTHGKNGGNSSFSTMVAIGGGGGGHTTSASADSGGSSGGSGGGGENYHATYASGAGTAGQGYAGGPLGTIAGAGGGGAGGPGKARSGTNVGGNGGPGLQFNITGALIYYAAGGGGAQSGSAGAGGNGDASSGAQNAVGLAGRANSGDGGGGGWNYTGGNGGAGGSGVIIIAFPVSSGIDADGGSVSVSGGYEIHKFTSSGTFTVNSLGSASCPSDPRCSVTVNGNVRSSFSIPKPTVDSTGRALTIANNGYVEITRTSSGSVWRTYRQPAVQAAVVPDLCSGNATTARGWNAVVLATQQDVIASSTAAQTIAVATGSVNAGTMYFRKDFNVSKNGTYNLNLYTSSSQDAATAFIDGTSIDTTAGGLATTPTTLLAGCHTLVVKLTNQTYLPRASDFTLSLGSSASVTPIVVSDTSWRVTTGNAVHYSTSTYDETNAWEPVTLAGKWNDTTLPWGGNPTDWGTISGDTTTQWVTTTYSSGASFVRPPASYAWFRQGQSFTTTGIKNVTISTVCDDGCDVYLDGNLLVTIQYAQKTVTKDITIQPGTHTFGIRMQNGGTSANASGFLFSAYDNGANAVLARGDANWDATTSWSSVAGDPFSYDSAFRPVPAI